MKVEVRSKSRPDIIHIVDTEELTCTCEYFQWRLKSTGEFCKHLKEVLKIDEEKKNANVES